MDDEYDWVDDDDLDLAETQRRFTVLKSVKRGQTLLLVVSTGRTVAPDSYGRGPAEALNLGSTDG